MKSLALRRVLWSLGLSISLVCMYLSLHLALLHYKTPKDTGGLLGNVCTAFADSSCEKVAQSRWAWVPPLPAPEEAKPTATGAAGKEAEEKDLKTADPTKSKESVKAIPTAQLGLIFFSVMFCWFAFTGARSVTRSWPHVIITVVALAGIPASAFYEYVMWTQLEAWCPLCVATHAGSLLLAMIVLLLWPRTESPAPVEYTQIDEPPSPVQIPTEVASEGLFSAPAPAAAAPTIRATSSGPWPTARVLVSMLALVVVLVLLEHFYILNRSYKIKADGAKAMQDYYTRKFMQYERAWQHNFMAWQLMRPVNVPIEGRPVRGPATAVHTIVVFSDFECPACARFEKYLIEAVLPMGQRSGNGFKVVFKHWPICKDCNDVMAGNTLHPAACQAAYAAEAARLLGGDEAFWKMHDLLFENQNTWKKSRDFAQYARQIGLDEAAFLKSMASSEALSRVRADVADGAAMGSEIENPEQRAEIKVDSTPTIFVDGKRLNSPTKGKTWLQILRTPVAPMSAATRPAGQPPGPRVPATN